MVTPELSKYVADQLRAGYSPDAIRSALVSGGWSPADAAQAVAPAPPPPAATNSPPPSKKQPLLMFLITIFIGLGIIAAVYVLRKPAPARFLPPSAYTSSSPAPSSPPSPTSLFKDLGLSFSYDSSWKKVGMNGLLTGQPAASPSAGSLPESQYLFFAPDHYRQVVAELQTLNSSASATPGFDSASSLLGQISAQTDLSLTLVSRQTALSSAQQATKSRCQGANLSFSTSNPVDNSRIRTATVAGEAAYYLLPEPGCSSQTLTLFFDNPLTSSTPTSLPGITIIGGPPSQNNSYIIAFPASDLAHLTSDQQLILQSLEFQ